MAMKRLNPKTVIHQNMSKSIVFTTAILSTIWLIHFHLDHSKTKLLDDNETKIKPQLGLVMDELGFVKTESLDDPFIPPESVSREERIEWFKQKLPKFDILSPKSFSFTQSFHNQVVEFLSRNCTVQLYMTWLTSAASFGKRQFLAIDSLFKANPKACLVIVSTSLDSTIGYRILEPLIDLGSQILIVAPDLSFLAKNTPAEQWLEEMKTGTRDPGSVPLSQNLSNLLRLLMLYKYGGIYMDTDLLVLRDLSSLRNCVGAQSINPLTREWTRLNGAVMVFDMYHPLLRDFLEEFASSFDGNRWGFNGPYLISRVIERVTAMKDWNRSYNFNVMPTWAFYPVNWLRINRLMSKPVNESEATWDERILKEFNGKETYAVHLWYKWSKDYKIEEGSVVARLVSDHCLVCYNVSS